MRQAYIQAYNNLPNLHPHTPLLQTPPSTPQQHFLQTLLNLHLYTQKQPLQNIQPLLQQYKGSFSQQILTLKYCTYCMEKDKTKVYGGFVILRMLAKWVEIFELAKKRKDVRLYEIVVEGLDHGCCTYEEFVVYLNYIANDVVGLIKAGTQESKKKYPDMSKHPHLDANDLVKFLNAVLPKVLTNMMVPRNFFPPTLLKSTSPQLDILYSCQTIQNITQNKIHYNTLIRSTIKALLSLDLQPSQTKQLVLNSFKYYYLYHHDKNFSASQYVIESFKKMSSAVRFALVDQIGMFFAVLRKLGKQLFISYLGEKFSWVAQTVKMNNSVMGINRTMFKPFFNMAIGNSLKIKVDAGKIQHYYMEIYDRFSLAYFCVRCLEHDITIRFYYMGKFDQAQGTEEKKLLVCSQKKQGIFEGSIQTIEQGIYMFEFDNSYAWMKAKTVAFDLSILVPIEIREHAKNKTKQFIFERHEHLNQVPYENVIGWIDQNEIKLNSTSANVSYTVEGNIKVYNVKLIKNTGQAYQYETESKFRFVGKLHLIEKDPNLFWLIDGFKVRGVSEVQRWLDGEFEPERLPILHGKEEGKEREGLEEEVEEERNQKEEESQAQLIVNKDPEQVSSKEGQKPEPKEVQVKDGQKEQESIAEQKKDSTEPKPQQSKTQPETEPKPEPQQPETEQKQQPQPQKQPQASPEDPK